MAQRVVGVNPSSNNAERLATQTDQASGNAYLSNINNAVVSNINLSDDKVGGMFTAFAGADELGREVSTLEAQSNTYIVYEVNENAICQEIPFNYNNDPAAFIQTQISKIIISGYNNSAIPLEFKFFLYNPRLNRYNVFYKKVFDITSNPTIGQSAQDVIQFILPAPIGDWDRYYNRFGYFIIEPIGDPSEASFGIDVIIYQRNYLLVK